MAINTSKIIIETMVRKAIKNMKKSPNRTMRNLIDLALQFSEGHFQKHFYEVAQTMLKNKKSSYFALVPALVSDIDTERLVRFGMNLGYNSCTQGAKIIRDTEEHQGFNVPWSVFCHMDATSYINHSQSYHQLIQDGKELGIYTWQIFADRHPEVLLPLAEENEDCAFILYCNPDDLTLLFLDHAADLNNIMLGIHYDEHIPDVYETLWDSGLLYSVFYEYKDSDLEYILSGDFLSETEQVHPVFTGLLASSDCSQDTQKAVYDYVQQTRMKQIYLTVPWEIMYDNRYIDTIISGDPCSLAFDCDGTIYTMYQRRADLELNLFRNDLQTILKQAFPKN